MGKTLLRFVRQVATLAQKHSAAGLSKVSNSEIMVMPAGNASFSITFVRIELDATYSELVDRASEMNPGALPAADRQVSASLDAVPIVSSNADGGVASPSIAVGEPARSVRSDGHRFDVFHPSSRLAALSPANWKIGRDAQGHPARRPRRPSDPRRPLLGEMAERR